MLQHVFSWCCLPCPLLALMTAGFWDGLHCWQVLPGMTLVLQQSAQSFLVPRACFFCPEHEPVDWYVTVGVDDYSFGHTISLFLLCSSPTLPLFVHLLVVVSRPVGHCGSSIQ